MALDKQISLFKIDTNGFRTDEEKDISRTVQLYSKKCLKRFNKQTKGKDKKSEEYLDYKKKYNTNIRIIKNSFKPLFLDLAKEHLEQNKKALHPDIRELDESYLSYIDWHDGKRKINLTNVVSMFESTLSRSFEIQTDELTYDIFIVEIYYYDIAQDLIINGFNYNGKHYVYFSF